MEPTLNFLSALHLLGAAQGIFLAFVFFFDKRGNPVANRFLGLFLFVFSLRLLEIVAFWSKYLLVFPHFFATTFALPYLFGVFFYFYAKHLSPAPKKLEKHFALHLIPFLIYMAYLSPYYLFSADEKRFFLENFIYGDSETDNNRLSWFGRIIYLMQFPHLLLYIFFSVKELKQRVREWALKKDSAGRVRIQWLQGLILGFSAFFSLWFLYNIALTAGLPYHQTIDFAVTTLMTVFIYAIGYFAFKLPEIFSQTVQVANGPKYQKSTLTPEQAANYVDKLDKMMVTERLFTEPALRLPALAEKLGISPNHLSQILNEQLAQNFYDYINRYRVEAAKQLLADSENRQYTLLSIAYDVGFNNKTSFNKAFKKHTGLTPSEFRKKNS